MVLPSQVRRRLEPVIRKGGGCIGYFDPAEEKFHPLDSLDVGSTCRIEEGRKDE